MRPCCPTCGQQLPRPPARMPAHGLAWDDHYPAERRVVVSMYLAGLGRANGGLAHHHQDPLLDDWSRVDVAKAGRLAYARVNTALVRLVAGGWLTRVRRGCYRMTVDGHQEVAARVQPYRLAAYYDTPRKKTSPRTTRTKELL